MPTPLIIIIILFSTVLFFNTSYTKSKAKSIKAEVTKIKGNAYFKFNNKETEITKLKP